MAAVRWLCAVVILVEVFVYTQATPNLAGKEYVFEVKEGDKVCLYASFQLDFKISYRFYPNISNTSIIQIMSKDIHLPNNTQVKTTGDCGSQEITLELSWKYGDTTCNSSFIFSLNNNSWYASYISFSFDFSSFNNPVESGSQTYVTDEKDLFTRQFSRHEYFYCEKCKTFIFSNCSEDTLGTCVSPCSLNNVNKTECNSTVDMLYSIIYPGDITTDNPGRQLCIEDYIALQELIVPIVVGGILAILLLLIFVSYIIAYARRRRKEGRYERLGEATY